MNVASRLPAAALALGLLASCQQRLAFYDPEHTRQPTPAVLIDFGRHQDFPDPPTNETAKALTGPEDQELDRIQVIEFDDEGELWERPAWLKPQSAPELGRLSQFERTIAAVRLARARDVELTVVLFVHGWKNDANTTDYDAGFGNLAQFATFVSERNSVLRTYDKPGPETRRTRVLGIALAWRGTPWKALRQEPEAGYDVVRLANELPLNLTLWNRLGAAERVGRASATQVMLTLAAEAKRLDIGPKENLSPPAKVIFVGHSMGARVLERAVAQAMIGGAILNAPIAIGFAEKAWKLEQTCQQHNDDIAEKDRLIEHAVKVVEQLEGDDRDFGRVRKRDNDADNGWKTAWNSFTEWWAQKMSPFGLAASLPPTGDYASDVDGTLIADAAKALDSLATNPSDEKQSQAIATARETLTSLQTQLKTAKDDLRQTRREVEILRQKNAGLEDKLAAARAELKRFKEARSVIHQNLESDRRELTMVSQRRDMALARPADLILLFNPATEAVVSRQIAESLRNPWLERVEQVREQVVAAKENAGDATKERVVKALPWERPWIISVSSPADRPTKWFFPLGAFFRASLHSYRTDNDQRRFFSQTAPHVAEFCNYEITYLQSNAQRTVSKAEDWISANFSAGRRGPRRAPPGDLPTSAKDPDEKPLPTTERECDLQLIIARDHIFAITKRPPDKDQVEHPGYWVIEADRRLIQGHNDEFSERAQALIAALMRRVGLGGEPIATQSKTQ